MTAVFLDSCCTGWLIYLMVSHNPSEVEQNQDEESPPSALQGSSRLVAGAHAREDAELRGASCGRHSDEESMARIEAAWLCGEHAMMQMLKLAD